MTYPTLAIIGTAGRKEDKAQLSHLHYDRMVQAAVKLILHIGIDHLNVKVFSGGAAWADHVVVTLALLGGVSYENVTLFLPAVLEDNGFVGHDERSTKTADTCNYYHRIFSKVTGKDSIRDLLEIREKGSNLLPGKGSFHARNSDVAKAVSPDGALLAYTFGGEGLIQQPIWTIRKFSGEITADDAGLKDGGTADTWNKCSGTKFHCRLGTMEMSFDDEYGNKAQLHRTAL